jgi:hypothetical protein
VWRCSDDVDLVQIIIKALPDSFDIFLQNYTSARGVSNLGTTANILDATTELVDLVDNRFVIQVDMVDSKSVIKVNNNKSTLNFIIRFVASTMEGTDTHKICVQSVGRYLKT